MNKVAYSEGGPREVNDTMHIIVSAAVFAFLFTIGEIVAYIIINAAIGVAVLKFSWPTAIEYGLDATLWRVLYLQALLQACLLVGIGYFGYQRNVLFVVVTVLVAFALLEIILGAGISRLVKQFSIDLSQPVVGVGLLLLGSSTLAWLIYYLLSKLRQA